MTEQPQGLKRDLDTAALEEAEMNAHIEQLEPVKATTAPGVTTSAEEAEMAAQNGETTAVATPSASGATQEAGPSKQTQPESRPPKKSRYEGKHVNYRSRDGGQNRPGNGDASAGATGEDDGEREKKRPKKKCAVLLGFSGAGYSGMQIQTDPNQTAVKTIEQVLFNALAEAGAISKENSDDHRKVDLARAARTDAGVSAAGNVVSLKMIMDPEGVDTPADLAKRVNELLPPEIRMWGYYRVLGSFNARSACESRVYEYLLPSYVLLPPRPGCVLDRKLQEYRTAHDLPSPAKHEYWSGGQIAAGDDSDAPAGTSTGKLSGEAADAARKDELARRRAWRAGKAEVDRLREIMQGYLGTHNFHNYTLFKPYNDKAVKRYMIDISVDEPEVYGNTEWISIKIHGQSFMLHQIRKMVSLAILMTRTATPTSLMEHTFGPNIIHIPKAPALGLLLERPKFGSYNDRLAKTKAKNNLDMYEPLSFDPWNTEIHAFKVKHIYERLRQDEEQGNVFVGWTAAIDAAETDDFGYLNPDGVIPESAKRAGKAGKGNKTSTLPSAESDDDEAKCKTANAEE